MNGLAIFEGDHAQVTLQLFDPYSVAHAAVFRLHFAAKRLAQRQLDPLGLDVRPFEHHVVAKVGRGLHAHLPQLSFRPATRLNTGFPAA